MDKIKPSKRWLWYFSLAAALIIVFKLCDNIGQVFGTIGLVIRILTPFVAGLMIAFLLHKPSLWLEKRFLRLKGRFWQGASRPLSLTIVYLTVLGVLALLISLVLPHLVTSLIDLFKKLPGLLNEAIARLETMKTSGLLENLHVTEWLDGLYESLVQASSQLISTENVMNALRGVLNFTTSIVDIVIAIIVSVYMLAGREHLTCEAKAVCGLFMTGERVNTLTDYGRKTAAIFYNYFYGALLDALVVGVVVSIGLSVFRVPYAVLLGLSLGLLNMIPYFGAIIGCIGIVLVTLLTNNIYAAIGVAIFVIVVQQVDANIIQPRVVGSSVGLRPIYVLLAITLFGGLFGFWGIFLGVPIMAVIQMFVKDAIAYKREKQAKKNTPIE